MDEELLIRREYLGSSRPIVHPVMKELVRRGVKALPDLINHVSDQRPIAIEVGAGGVWHSDEYDAKPPPGKHRAADVNTGKKAFLKEPYAFRVGDLCYAAIGQIVNRRFDIARSQHRFGMVINSPPATPELAAAIKLQWAGLTADEHRQSLIVDCLDTRPYTDWDAWQRLHFYYPDQAEAIALKLLSRPLYDQHELWNFIQYELVKEQDEAKWQVLIDQYIEANGTSNKEMLPFWLHWIYWETSVERTESFLADRAIAQKILQKLYPDFDREKPAFLNAANGDDHATSIRVLTSYPSRKVDQQVWGLLLAAANLKSVEGEKYRETQLVEACLARLCRVKFEVNGDPDSLLLQIKQIIAEKEPSREYCEGARCVALRAALQFFPKQSQMLFENYRSASAELTREAKLDALKEPTDAQTWMIEYLTSLLDDTTETEDFYGPSWDWQMVRVCDQAAKVLADDYLHVRFEFEENPGYLTQQIAKIRRVLAGEKNISFDPPPVLMMPQDLPTRAATRVVDLKTRVDGLYAFSTDLQLWIRGVFDDRGRYVHGTLRFDIKQDRVVEQTRLDHWDGEVNLLPNGLPRFAYCYHGNENGQLLIRSLPNGGRVVKTVKTPFHDGTKSDKAFEVSNRGGATLCGKDARWMMALTDNVKLHSVDIETEKHQIEWEYPGDKNALPWLGSLVGLQGSSIVLMQFDDSIDQPLRIWDQSTRTMRVIQKAPGFGWQSGWGKLAWNSLYQTVTVWNLQTVEQIVIPKREGTIEEIACDSDQSTMFVLRDSAIDVFRIIDAQKAQPIRRLVSPELRELTFMRLVVSTDDRWLFVYGSKAAEAKQPDEHRQGVVAIFDVSDLAKRSTNN